MTEHAQKEVVNTEYVHLMDRAEGEAAAASTCPAAGGSAVRADLKVITDHCILLLSLSVSQNQNVGKMQHCVASIHVGVAVCC